MKPGPLIMLIVGIVLTLLGAGLTAGGTFTALGNSAQGQDGYLTSPTAELSTDTYALVNRSDNPDTDPPSPTDRVDPELASLRLTAASTTGDDVFVGIAPAAAVDEYLAGVNHTEVRDFQAEPFRVRYVDVPGSERPTPPASQDFWTESASGPGEQAITMSWEPGAFSIVVMNADARQVVSVDVELSAHVGFLGPVATTLIGVGVLTVLIGLLLLILGIVGLAKGSAAHRDAAPTA